VAFEREGIDDIGGNFSRVRRRGHSGMDGSCNPWPFAGAVRRAISLTAASCLSFCTFPGLVDGEFRLDMISDGRLYGAKLSSRAPLRQWFRQHRSVWPWQRLNERPTTSLHCREQYAPDQGDGRPSQPTGAGEKSKITEGVNP